MLLRNKVVVITGGTRSLGRSIAAAMLREGAHVVCAARAEHDLDQLMGVSRGKVSFTPVDVRDRSSVEKLMHFAAAAKGRVDILVANAGVSRDGPVDTLPIDDWADVISTNLTGTFHCIQAVIPYMRRQGGGTIITISSALSTRVAAGAGAYCASKAAIDMLTRVSAAELADDGIRVNALAPGFIDEGMGKRLADNDALWETYQHRLLARRLGTADEVGRAAVFLASDHSSYINGHVLEVNGGLQWT
jgi:3-oxoacyl-[acyl-carrier protein] reductase